MYVNGSCNNRRLCKRTWMTIWYHKYCQISFDLLLCIINRAHVSKPSRKKGNFHASFICTETVIYQTYLLCICGFNALSNQRKSWKYAGKSENLKPFRSSWGSRKVHSSFFDGSRQVDCWQSSVALFNIINILKLHLWTITHSVFSFYFILNIL